MKVEFDVEGFCGAAILSALRTVAVYKGDGFTSPYENTLMIEALPDEVRLIAFDGAALAVVRNHVTNPFSEISLPRYTDGKPAYVRWAIHTEELLEATHRMGRYDVLRIRFDTWNKQCHMALREMGRKKWDTEFYANRQEWFEWLDAAQAVATPASVRVNEDVTYNSHRLNAILSVGMLFCEHLSIMNGVDQSIIIRSKDYLPLGGRFWAALMPLGLSPDDGGLPEWMNLAIAKRGRVYHDAEAAELEAARDGAYDD